MTQSRFPKPAATLVGRSILACAMLPWAGRAAAPTQLPIPCLAGACGANASGFVSTGAATAVQSGKNLSVTQTTNTATLNWASFNIGAGGKVAFTQPSSTSVALNRIFDANPSSILGSLTANGQIYLLNANGFLFGPGANVNVAGLIASSLNITPQTFATGILAPFAENNAPALQPFTDASGNTIVNTGKITVQAGAQLTAADSGRLLLAAPTVQNAGSLSSPDGQVILAAGQKVYLAASSSPDLRGLIVEVDGGGTAANQLTGQLTAARGNVSMVGLAVNQDGRVSATTSVSANGSVSLVGADSFAGSQSLTPTHGGTVELGAGSSIQILPEYGDTTTAVAAQVQLPSEISITAEQVLMHGGSIKAPGGALNVLALGNPNEGLVGTDAQARIRIDAGTTIDLSGSDAQLPMSANLVTVQLRSNELADDPTQRNGALRGDTVTIDIRADGGAGTPLADVSSAIAAVGSNIAQRTETGGTINFQSEGDIVFNPGASINVSGGATTYQAGTIQTTALVGANGRLYDIGSANPLLTYTGVVNPTLTQVYDKWGVQEVVPTPGLSHYQSGYVQGAAAGSIQFAAPSMVLDGALQGAAVSGPYQRGPVGTAFGDSPPGATLVIGIGGRPSAMTAGSSPGTVVPQFDFFSPSVALVANPIPIVVADNAPLPVQTLQLPASYLTASGFSNTQIYSNGSVTLPSGLPLQLTPNASLLIEASRIDVDSSISASAGSLSFENVLTVATPGPAGPRPGVGIGAGVTLDVSGQWTNDNLIANGVGTAPTLQNAGSINLQLNGPGSELVLGNNVALKADGGAWLQSGGGVTYGTGGAITLDASPAQAAVQFGSGTSVQAFGTGTAAGGSFSLLAPRIDISRGNGSAWTAAQRADDLAAMGQVLDLYAPLFADYGFSAINLTATGAAESGATSDVLTVASGTTISPQTRSRELLPGYQGVATGGDIAQYMQAQTLPAYLRPSANVSLSVLRLLDDLPLGVGNFGTIDVQAGASILSDPNSSISLTSEGSIAVAGTLRAPGGKVALEIISPSDVNSNTADGFDPGYVSTQGIALAGTAVFDVSGTAIMTPNTGGFLLGSVLAGGSVILDAERGTVVAESGSAINISGTSATLDVAVPGKNGVYSRTVVASAGGSLSVSSNESISLLGKMSAAAGEGNAGRAAAGSLTVDMSRGTPYSPNLPQLPGSSLQIELVDSTAGTTPNSPQSNMAVLGVQQLERSGFDSLTLQVNGGTASGTILVDAGAPLTMARQIIFDAPSITVADGVNANFSAPFVQIGNSATSGQSAIPPPATVGTGTLTVSAQQIDLLGGVTLQGITGAVLRSQGDVQLQGTNTVDGNPTGPQLGSLVSSGNLTIDAARVYPDTYTDFTLQLAQGTGSTVTIGQTSPSPGSPLSADGSVKISADNIFISGTLLAPFGSIDLSANDSLTLARGSLVSVSGAGLDVPFGQTQLSGSQWIYQTPNGSTNQITSVPTKQVLLTAPNIAVQSAATVNLQGGGDLFAYEWVPGTGGSRDALALGTIPGLYAILPAARGQAAPYDAEESGVLGRTQTVYLSGGAGIAAGYYALLPPRYALEPGAVLVQMEPSYVSTAAGQIGTLADGTPVIGGFLGFGTTGLHAGLTEYQGFAIYPGSYGQQLAAYNLSNASSYFGTIAATAGTGPVPEPADAGTLTLVVSQQTSAALSNSLNLQGSVLTAPAGGGRGAPINISAPDLFISADGESVDSAAGITVSGSVLQSWNASVLTLGGTTTITPSAAASTATSTPGATIAVAAQSVTVGSGVTLTADQIFLAAQQSIDLKSGAALDSTSGAKGSVLSSLPQSQVVTLTDAANNPLPQGALLAVSDLNLPVVDRSQPNGAPGAAINLEAGAALKSGGAIALDAPGSVALAGSISGKGASWSLSSSSIAFVGSGTSPDTLNIGSGLLASLQQAGAVRLASAGAIDILAPVGLGAAGPAATPTLKALTLLGTSLNNAANSDSLLGAATLTFEGVAGSEAAFAAGTGTLSLAANTLVIGPGTLAVNGFAHTRAQVAGAVETQGSGSLNVGGDLSINAVELTSAPDATDPLGTTLQATGMLTIGAPTKLAPGNSLPTYLGGNLTLSAAAIEDSGAIAVPSGLVTLDATSGNLHLTRTASIDLAGTTVQAVDQTESSPGGALSIITTGNATLDAGSRLSVAGAGAAPAGSIAISGGVVDVSSTLTGSARAGTGGSFTLNAGESINGLTALASNLTAGGFTDSIDIRVRGGDLDLGSASASNARLTANNITLTADAGAVNIYGVLSAPSAVTRGLIDLSGGNGVSLYATGQLHADGTGSAGRGGEIDINSTCPSCAIALSPGSVISAQGSAQMGQLVLRAPAVSGADVVAINRGAQGLGADVSRVGQVIIEPVMVYAESGSTINADLPTDVGTAAGFLASASPAIASRLAVPGATPIAVQAGLEIQDADPNDVLKLQPFNFAPYSTQGQVVDLTVRAAGSVTITGTISDGVVSDPATGLATLYNCASGPCASGSLSFIAGADLSSANPLSTLAVSSASLTLGSTARNAAPTVVRTGTGDLNLVAAGDVQFNSGAAAYTTGTDGALPIAIVTGTGAARTTNLVNFMSGGGNLRIAAGADVVGAPVSGDNGNYSVTGWQIRQGDSTTAALYGINLAGFDWNAGALGGGDVTVTAGGQVSNLSAAAADSYVDLAHSANGAAGLIGAGGGLSIASTGDIGSAQVYVADGAGTLNTGGGLTAIRTTSVGGTVGSSFALGNSGISVWARQAVQVDAVYNPTYVAQSAAQGTTKASAFFTYGDDSALNLESTDGDVLLEMFASNSIMGTLVGPKLIAAKNGGANFLIMPGSLSIESLQQDIDLQPGNNGVVLYPSARGQLDLFAARDIVSNGSGVTMADSFASSLPTVASPGTTLPIVGTVIYGMQEFQGDIHAGDSLPAMVTAGRDIQDIVLSIPKASQIVAARDMVDVSYTGQNLSANDTTLISAGRDLIYTGQSGGIQVGGPGSVEVLAGRNINLGFADGIVTVGNLENANLPSGGADLSVMLGFGTQGPDNASFLKDIVAPSASYSNELISYVEGQTDASGLTFAQAESAFSQLEPARQATLIDGMFFNELLLSGRAANSGTGVGFTQGYAAIEALFPGSQTPAAGGAGKPSSAKFKAAAAVDPNPYSGDLNMTFSEIYTLSGGNISILVPGGAVDVGLANPPAILAAKPASQLGIVAEGPGNVDIYALGDVNVNKSRVFTLGGGNILIWSDQGSIDAGNGSKSSLSVPPPVVLINSEGQITLDYAGSLAAGSGIRTIQTNLSIPAGNVDLDAPVGTVNAGDAGIGAAGNINIAAAHVIGVNNINFGGTATGVPSDVSNLGASLAGVSAIASSSTSSATASVSEGNSAKEAAPSLSQSALSWLDVFVTGLGEENCKPDDIECLKRQRAASP